MPAVTVELRPSGEPIATTGSPTCSAWDSAQGGGRHVFGLLAVEDREVVDRRCGRRPWRRSGCRPGRRSRSGRRRSAACATTWLLVMTWPERRRARSPSRSRRPPGRRTRAEIWTVLGSSSWATAATESCRTGSGACETVPAAASPPRDPTLGARPVPALVRRSADETADHADDQGQDRDDRPQPARHPSARGRRRLRRREPRLHGVLRDRRHGRRVRRSARGHRTRRCPLVRRGLLARRQPAVILGA